MENRDSTTIYTCWDYFIKRKNKKDIWDSTNKGWDYIEKEPFIKSMSPNYNNSNITQESIYQSSQESQIKYKEELYKDALAVDENIYIKKIRSPKKNLFETINSIEAPEMVINNLRNLNLGSEDSSNNRPENISENLGNYKSGEYQQTAVVLGREGEFTHLLIFHSGRTIIGVYTEMLEPNTKVFVESDRGEDVATVLDIYDDADSKAITYKNLVVSQKDIYTNESYDNKTAEFFMNNYLYAKHINIKRVAMIQECVNFIYTEKENSALEYINNIKGTQFASVLITKCEYQWDGKRLTVYYRASERIDFRSLVRQLFKHFRIRIWMCSENRELYKQYHH